jgi:hypothetical protein
MGEVDLFLVTAERTAREHCMAQASRAGKRTPALLACQNWWIKRW